MIKVARIMAMWGLIVLLPSVVQAAEKRVALVIGNASYQTAAVLQNTLNDAEAMSSALKSVGFEVLDGRNLHKDGMGKMLGQFAKMLQGADAGLVYYSGHGLQFEGQNYLISIDSQVEDEFSLRFEATRLEDVIATLQYTSGVKILVLDACRNNPFVTRLALKSGARDIAVRGLAPIKRTHGMLIAYATQANDVASDGSGKNSPFTEALAREITRPGEEITTVFRNVQTHVYKATDGRQLPELSISLLGDFYFSTAETDMDAWKKVSLSSDQQELGAFIKKYPESNWAEAARMRLRELAEKERLLAESTERERVIRELSSRAEALGEKIKQAEEKRLKATEEFEKRAQISSQQASNTEQSKQAAAAQAKTERERLAAAVHEQENLVLTLSAERQRIEAERRAAEQASNERLKAHASLGKVDEPVSQLPANAATSPTPNIAAPMKCTDILARLQLGDQSQSDLDALKHKNCEP